LLRDSTAREQFRKVPNAREIGQLAVSESDSKDISALLTLLSETDDPLVEQMRERLGADRSVIRDF